ncbi:MAG: GNAT family N-acetyltransferase [Candidatus Thorarchaeota archaeon]
MKDILKLKTGEKIFIRHITELDIDGVWNNFNEVVEEGIYLPVLFPVKSRFEKQSWYNNIKKEREICIVAVNPNLKTPNNILGQCEISSLDWDAATHVGNLGVIVQKKYRDLGIGFHIIDMAIRESKTINSKEKIILSCFSNNKRALYLYEKMGFKTIGRREKQFYMDSKYYDEILMELWIDNYLANNP